MKRSWIKRSTKKKTKKEKTPLQLAKEELMSLAKKYIKLRDGPVCWTCGKTGLKGWDLQGGHFIRDSVGGVLLRYDEHNIHPQCYRCNIHLDGNEGEYTIKMVKEYGKKFVDKMFVTKNQAKVKWSLHNYLEKIEYYKEKIAKLNAK